jgi:N-acetylglucosaminyldiphosphoundecaprenol N-acetyl-beta-D-mannosaminyltransferase
MCNDIDFEKINIRGINFANVTIDEAAEIAKSYIHAGRGVPDAPGTYCRVIYTPNAEIAQACIEDKKNKKEKKDKKDKAGSFYEIINSADMIIPDGSGIILASRILKTPLKQKVGGFDLAHNNIIPYLDETGRTLFLLGSKEEIVEKAAANLKERYKNLKIFYNDGFFDKENGSEENEAVIKKINDCAPDVVIVCLGALGLKQEKWIFENKDKINAKLMIGLGGTIDIIAGVKKYAPEIFRKLHIEWLYYYIRHPSRIKRFMTLPRFVWGTLRAKK